ncbi:MAG: ABC transporter ATP-binding protein [Phycisphaerales bacterium]|nr:ABC transporter ATP-binding protein [Phycisphaerales bacterium]
MSDALSIRSLSFAYPGSSWCLSVDALDVAAGEQVLLTGGSGRGKSTLLHLVAGLENPDAGTVRVAGTDIHGLRGAKRDLFRGRHVGMIFQTFNLLHGFSALENVMAALMFSAVPRREHRQRARGLLEQLGIERIGASPTELSIGQQQRVAVARALVVEPALVLADEPTASLDPENTVAAMTMIQDACRERNAALLCVSHEPVMRDRFPRRHTLDELAPAGAAKGGA